LGKENLRYAQGDVNGLIERAKAMKTRRYTYGFTLVEMLIVVAVVALLSTMVIGVASRIDSQAKERLTESTITILDGALEQFRDYGYIYKVLPIASKPEQDFYQSLEFPLDCSDFDLIALQTTLANALGTPVSFVALGHDPTYSGSEVLYFFLSRVPESQKTLDRIDKSLLTNKDYNKQPMSITVGVINYPLMRIVDPWSTALRYDYYYEREQDPVLRQRSKKTFPVITSAGPDRIFGTADDMSNR